MQNTPVLPARFFGRARTVLVSSVYVELANGTIQWR